MRGRILKTGLMDKFQAEKRWNLSNC
jgi:hypothetical protein